MRDVQMLSELVIVIAAKDIRGFGQDDIDSYTARYQDAMNAEPDVERTEEDILEDFHRAKRYLVDLNSFADITNYTKEARHLYSVWALICLTEILPSAEVLGSRYVQFMAKVSKIKVADPSKIHVAAAASAELLYAANCQGPSTELPQRRARHESLTTIVAD